jgi:hypothetical protein
MNFIVKAYSSSNSGVRNIEFHACSNIHVEWGVDDSVILSAESRNSPEGATIFSMSNKSDSRFDEIIIENMNGKTVHRWVQ